MMSKSQLHLKRVHDSVGINTKILTPFVTQTQLFLQILGLLQAAVWSFDLVNIIKLFWMKSIQD